MRSACLPDDLRDSYNKDSEHQRPPTYSAPEKPPTAGNFDGGHPSRNNGIGAAENATNVHGGNNGYGGNGNGGVDAGNSGGGNESAHVSGGRVTATTVPSSLTVTPRSVQCKYPCLNGGTCQGSVCACRQGYSGENCAIRE